MSYIISRRKFLQYSGALIATGSLAETFSQSKPSFRFGIVTDSHYADRDPAGTRYYRESVAKMEEAMQEMNRMKMDFVIHLGDFKDQAEQPDEQSTLSYLIKLEQTFTSFKGPRYHVLGNHDADSISKEQFLDHVTNTGIDKTLTYYSFDNKGIHFIVLDADFTKDGVPYNKGNFDWKDTFIPPKEMTWLKNDLNKTKLPVIVFSHQLLDDVDDADYCVSNAKEVRDILADNHKVLAVFQGHRHEVRYNRMSNIHYCTLPGMVDYSGLENNSFSVIEVYPGGDLNMIGYKRAPGRELPQG